MTALRDRPLRILGGRPAGFVARNIAQPRNYVALANMLRRFPRPLDAGARYFTGRGTYPARVAVRTPSGTLRPTLWSAHDMVTLNEMFCREDYRIAGPPRLAVDIGSNIGLSALYFLSRGPGARCHLYEPVARNVERLRENLRGYEDRFEIQQAAVADFAGEAPFRLEETGRYGGLGGSLPEMTTVPVIHIDTALERALEVADTISVLKIDVEGDEGRLLAGARPDLLARVELIYAEAFEIEIAVPDGFQASEDCDTMRMHNIALATRSSRRAT